MDVFESDQIRLRRSQSRRHAENPSIPSWALDLALLGFGGATLWMVTQTLRFDDPRPERNAWTYIILIPATVLAIDLLMRSFVSRFIERAIQSAFLFSVMLHLLLTFGAVNLVLFSRNSPELSAALATSPEVQNVNLPSERPPAPEYFESKDFDVESETQSEQRPEYMQPARTKQSDPNEAEASKQDVAHKSDVATVDAPQQEVSPPSAMPLNKVEKQLDQPEITSEAIAITKSEEIVARESSALEVKPIAVPEGNTLDELISQDTPTAAASSMQALAVERPNRSAASQALSLLPEASLDIALTENPNATFARPNRLAIDAPRRGPSFQESNNQDFSDMVERMNRSTPSLSSPKSKPTIVKSSIAAPSLVEVPDAQESPSYGATQSSQDLSSFAPNQDSVAIGRRSDFVTNNRIAKAKTDSTSTVSNDSTPSTSGQSTSTLLEPSFEPKMSNAISDISRRSTASLERKSSQFRDLEPEVAAPAISVPSRFPKSSAARMAPSTSAVPIPAAAFQQRMARNEGASNAADSGDFGPETEAAIERGLQFLSRYQRDDGSWHLEDFGDNPRLRSDTAATGLSLLAFQGAGYSHRQYQYANVCKSALEYLIANQRPNGDLYIAMDDPSNSNVRFYSHSIAALALCEAYGMTQDEALKEPAQRAVDFMVNSQDPVGGGWRYQPNYESDTSVSGWFMMALKSAELSGLVVPKETFTKIEGWLDKAQASSDQRYLYRYNPLAPDAPATRRGREINPTMTGVGLLMRLYLGWRRDNENMGRGADYLLQNPPSMGTASVPLRDTYYWYYATQVMFHMGGERWRKWNALLHPLLIKTQQLEGPDSGSWNPAGPIPDRWGPFAGRLYVTTLNLLSLEVYYRHLPIYEDTAR
jgi:hypothetical protein